ncbi:MAG: hypothetical protein KAZ52_03180 [Candidatus Planktophila sp.]|jgi:hypothetical protein|nr:hypothetical protein [Candidatus Planktophila sp.]
MTQDKNHGSENLNWMEIAETDAINEVRHSGQRLPFIAAAVSLLIIGAGAVFAQTSNEAPAQAEEISTTQTPVAISNPASSAPMIPDVAPGVGNYEDDDDDHDRYEDDDHDRYEDDDDDHEDDD